MIETFREIYIFLNDGKLFCFVFLPKSHKPKDSSLQDDLCFIKYIWKHVTDILHHLETVYKVNTSIFSTKQVYLTLNGLTTP